MRKKDRKKKDWVFPARLLQPIYQFLERELLRLKRRQRSLKQDDPFSDESRTTSNSVEDDVDEQMGHFSTEVKANFVKKRIVALRKALTRIKLGRYGVCESCGKMIDTDRLAVKPEAAKCIECEKEK